MNELWIIGFSILIVDVISPVLIGMVLLALTTERPIALSLSVILGHTVAYLSVGLLILFGLSEPILKLFEPVLERWQNPMAIDFVIGFLIGVALLVFALRLKYSGPPKAVQETKPPAASIGSAFVAGVAINIAGAPFALPYFAFINQIMRLPESDQLIPLLIYNLGFALPFLLGPLALLVFGSKVLPVLRKIDAWIERSLSSTTPIALGLIGLVMICDAVLFFTTGQGLY